MHHTVVRVSVRFVPARGLDREVILLPHHPILVPLFLLDLQVLRKILLGVVLFNFLRLLLSRPHPAKDQKDDRFTKHVSNAKTKTAHTMQ